jgi:propanediol dehydratase small subunit
MTRAKSGRSVDDVTLDDVRADNVGVDDIRIDPSTLEHQAEVAQAHENPQLAANFRRAAELSLLPDDLVLSIYEALRPRRSTLQELERIAQDLQDRGAPLNAALVREAADAYQARGLLA